MKLLIIGSKGFIGTHAVKYFRNKYEVWGADIIQEYNDTKYFQIDSTNSNFQEIFSIIKFDVCINCSGAASVPLSFENPLRDFELNVSNVFKLLSAIQKHSPQCKFINLSSAAVYGNPQTLPINEQYPINPISPYGKHKHYSEQIIQEFYDLYKIPTISFRIFSAYGEGLKKQLFWDLHKKALNKKSIELWGTGNETRDFIYIKDLVKIINLAIEKADFKGEVINIANGTEIKIKDAVQIFYNTYKPEIESYFNNKVRQGDPVNWCADISILKKWGYKAEYSLTTGLTNYIKWLKELK